MTQETCTLCGRRPEAPLDREGRTYCCRGCLDIDTALESANGTATDGDPDGDTAPVEAPERTYFRVDGMHSVSCEAFLERVAESREGVAEASASYVSETVRVDHDPAGVSAENLADALSTVGYAAHRRAEETEDGSGTRGRAPGVNQERGLGRMLGYRYAAGVIFGSFLLLPYVALLYPTHLANLLDWAVLEPFARTVTFDSGGGLSVLRLYLVLSGIVLVFTGLPLFRSAYVSLRMRRPDMHLLVALTVLGAFVYSTVAGLAGRTDVFFDLTVVVAAVVVAATFYESLSKQRAMDLLTELTISRVDQATVYGPDDTPMTVPVGELEAGDRVLVREGERVPVDGVLAEGSCTVDESVVTGESLPVEKETGESAVGGSVVTDGAAVLEVGEDATSTIDRLITAVWELQSGTHGVQRRADRLAARLIPAIVAVGVLAAGLSLATGSGLAGVVLSFLVVLVVSPWTLGLATPLSVATSIEEATERGVVVFDETVFERLDAVDVVVFDKTGTLTTGHMDVIEADAPKDALRAAGILERRGSHPAADAIASAFADARPDGGVEAGVDRVESFTSHDNGVEGVVDGTEVLVGHPDLLKERGWTLPEGVRERVIEARGFGRLPVVVGRDGRAEGLVVVGDEPRAGWDGTVSELADRGIEVVVLTGDDPEAAEFFAGHDAVAHVFAGVPPAGKTAAIDRLRSEGRVAMVGDGTNDAPALAAADLGISLGSGTAVASDAADLAVVDDDLGVVGTAFDLARAARRRVIWNNRLALVYPGVTVPLAALGTLNPLLVMGAAVLTCGVLGANSFRSLLPSEEPR